MSYSAEFSDDYSETALIMTGLGHVYNGQKKYDKAKYYFEEAISMGGKKSDNMAKVGLGWVYANQHNNTAAIAIAIYFLLS